MNENENNVTTEEQTVDYLKKECSKLNAELREAHSEIRSLKETIVKMAMKEHGVH